MRPHVMSMVIRTAIHMSLLSFMAGCGGEVPRLTQIDRPTDGQMSCMDLLQETSQNNLEIARLVDRDDQVHRRNVHYTVIDGVMVPPAMLTLDFRDQAPQEMKAITARNQRLLVLEEKIGC